MRLMDSVMRLTDIKTRLMDSEIHIPDLRNKGKVKEFMILLES